MTNNTKPNNKTTNIAGLFHGDSHEGTIPVLRRTLDEEPIVYESTATAVDLTQRMIEDFKALGIRQHRVRVTDGTMVGEHIVIFDDAYERCAWMPMAAALEEAARIAAEGSAKKTNPPFSDVRPVDPRTRTPHDDKHSQLRLMYDEDDPHKDRTLQFITELQRHTARSDDTLYFRTTWLDAYKLLTAVERGNLDVYRTHNRDGAPVMSGYDLIGAGLLNEAGEVTIHLTADEEPPSTHEDLKAAVLALAPHRGTPEFVMLTLKAQSQAEVVPILAKYSTHEPSGIARTEPNTYTMRFRCTNLPDLTAALLKDFSQFHLCWIDRVWTSSKTTIPVVGRFGESWTTDFEPLWFRAEEDGDRYWDRGTVLVWNRLGHEYLTGDTLVKVGSPDSEYNYGLGATVANGEIDTDAVDAAIVAAAKEGKHYSTVLDGAF